MGNCLPRWYSGKESACQCRRCKRCGFDPWVRKIPWSRKWQPTPVFLPGKFQVLKSLAGYSPWDVTESDTLRKHLPYIGFLFHLCQKSFRSVYAVYFWVLDSVQLVYASDLLLITNCLYFCRLMIGTNPRWLSGKESA